MASYEESTGLTLPENASDLGSCYPYLKNLMWCYGPAGVWTGVYREGFGTTCVPYMDRLVTCAQVKITPSQEKKQALLRDSNERCAAERKTPDKAPVWKFRDSPPAGFHEYQSLTSEEEDRLWNELQHPHPTH